MKPPPGFFDPQTIVPGFESLGHWVPTVDVEALRILCSHIGKHSHQNHIANIGTFAGCTAAIIAEAVESPYGVSTVRCIDTWNGSSRDDSINSYYDNCDVYACFHANAALILRRFSVSLPFHRQNSIDASLSQYNPRQYDLVFIDADHSYEAVKADIAAWTPKVRKGGVLAGHDYGVFEGVTRAVNEINPHGLMGSVWWKIIGLEDGQQPSHETYDIGAL